MGERKVVNKYYPPDFKIPGRRKHQQQLLKNKPTTVRMMLPMSIRCTTCGHYIYKGTKFNSRKQDAAGQNYLGIQIFSFYFKCTQCCAELTIKTDPTNSDYTLGAGASRNFEPWRNQDEEELHRDAPKEDDAMKSLENRTLDSKRDMDIMSALDEMKSIKSRHATVSVDHMLKKILQCSAEDLHHEHKLDDRDEVLVKSIFHAPKHTLKRIIDDDDDDDHHHNKDKIGDDYIKRRKTTDSFSSKIIFKVKKKQTYLKKDDSKEELPVGGRTGSILHSLAQYDSEDDE